MIATIRLGADDVPYTLCRSGRRTLGITVHPDGSVAVTAPLDAPLATIEERLRRRGAWLLKARRQFERLRPRTPERLYVGGETHRFLGRQYRLAVEPEGPRGVEITRDYFIVRGLDRNEHGRIRNRLALWYQREARRVFAERLERCAALAHVASKPRLVVRPMEKRWGSLSATGRSLILNRRLIEADLESIDFVITHELCHVSHHHHGPEFLALLAARMPDWEKRKRRLEMWML